MHRSVKKTHKEVSLAKKWINFHRSTQAVIGACGIQPPLGLSAQLDLKITESRHRDGWSVSQQTSGSNNDQKLAQSEASQFLNMEAGIQHSATFAAKHWY